MIRNFTTYAKNNDGITALMGAEWKDHDDTVAVLIENGTDVNVKENDGN